MGTYNQERAISNGIKSNVAYAFSKRGIPEKLVHSQCMNSSRIHTILSLLQLKGIGPAFLKKYELLIKDDINSNLDLPSLLGATHKDKYRSSEITAAAEKAQEIIELCRNTQIKIIDLFDEAYPSRLANMQSKWPLIYYKGKVDFPKKSVALIGNRQSTKVGQAIAQRLGRFFIDKDYQLVSRLTKGIDELSAIDSAYCQKSIGVLPGGLAFQTKQTLWKEQELAAETILSGGGGLISTFPPDLKQDQYTSISYCSLQAMLSDCLVLVQSKLDGEARYATAVFSKLKRKFGVVQASQFDPGNLNLYAANELILKKGKGGIAVFCDIEEEVIECEMVGIRGKGDYDLLLEEG